MSSFPPPDYNSDIFNAGLFESATDTLSLASADKRYIRINSTGFLSALNVAGNCNIGSLSISGSAVDLDVISGITAGTASNSKALVLNGSGGISGITSIGTTTLVLGGSSLGATEAGYLTSITAGTSSASKALVMNATNDIAGIRRLNVANNMTIGSADYGNSQRVLTMIIPTITAGQQRYFTFGRDYTLNNSCEWAYTYVGNSSTSNRMDFSFFGNNSILVLTAQRRVCIGAIDPTETLDVRGGVDINSSTGLRIRANSTATIQHTFTNSTENTLIINGTDSSSTCNFSVAGTIRANTNTDGLRIGNGSSASNANGVPLWVDRSVSVSMVSTGNQFTAPTNSWQSFLSGSSFLLSARMTGGIWLGSAGVIQTSDRRLKENIKDYQSDLDSFKKIEVKTFKWKGTDSYDTGCIAQQVGECIPHLVMDIPDDTMDDGVLHSINQTRLLYETVSALQLALKEIERMQSAIRELT